MKSSMKKIFVCVLALASSSALASTKVVSANLAGGADVGGGMGVVCRDSRGAIQSVELLDLWESRVVFGRTIVPLTSSVANRVHAAVDVLKDSLDGLGFCVDAQGVDPRGPDSCEKRGFSRGSAPLKQMLDRIADSFLASAENAPNIRRLRGVRLEKTNDAYEVVVPQDCEVDQLIRYNRLETGDFVLVDQDLVDHLDLTNLAALYTHEALYTHLRFFYEATSIRVRRAIGYVFAGGTFLAWGSELPAKHYRCGDAMAQVYLYERPDAAGKIATYFEVERIWPFRTLGWSKDLYAIPGTIEEAFHRPDEVIAVQGLGDVTGFDYSANLIIGGKTSNGLPKIAVMLNATPDPMPPTKAWRTIDCVSEVVPSIH